MNSLDAAVSVVTGVSQGLGRALVPLLLERGLNVVGDARDGNALKELSKEYGTPERLTLIPGDVTDPAHREELMNSLQGRPLRLLINNAGTLGPSPLPALLDAPVNELEKILQVNVAAPLALIQLLAENLRLSDQPIVVNVSSDAGVEAYEGWGLYGCSKACLDHLTSVLAVENPAVRFYSFDPGDMRTAMQQAAYPSEDISDRPLPETKAVRLMRLVDSNPTSGRYTWSDFNGS